MATQTDTKTRMVRAAAKLIWTQGLHGTGLQQILSEADAPRGSMYFHFPGGKEQLAVEAVREAGSRITELFTRLMEEHTDCGAALNAWVAKFSEQMEKSDFARGCPIATVTLEAAAGNERIRAACNQIYDEWRALIGGRLIRAGWDPERADAFATLELAAIEGALILSRAARSTKPLERVAEQVNLLLKEHSPS